MDALSLIELHRDSYTARELEVYEAVKAHPEAVLGSTATEFSETNGVSQSAVSRFCKRAGFEGYGDFRMAMHQAVYARGQDASLEREAGGFSSDLYRLCRLIEESVDKDEMDLLVERLRASRRIYVLGKGSSSIPARGLALALTLRSLPASFIETGWEEESLHCASAEDTYVIFSAKNPSFDGFLSTVSGLRKENRPHVTLISLTDRHPLKSLVDQMIVLPHNAAAGGAYLDSFISSTLFTELLVTTIGMRRPVR